MIKIGGKSKFINNFATDEADDMYINSNEG
jgi:hypothetical protein